MNTDIIIFTVILSSSFILAVTAIACVKLFKLYTVHNPPIPPPIIQLPPIEQPHIHIPIPIITDLQQEIIDSINEECIICYDNKPDTIFIPCYHQIICMDCLNSMIKHKNTNCPYCREEILFYLSIKPN